MEDGGRDCGSEGVEAHIVKIFGLHDFVTRVTGGLDDARVGHGEGNVVDGAVVFF